MFGYVLLFHRPAFQQGWKIIPDANRSAFTARIRMRSGFGFRSAGAWTSSHSRKVRRISGQSMPHAKSQFVQPQEKDHPTV